MNFQNCSIPLFLFIILFSSSCKKSTKFELLSPKETGITFNNQVLEKDSFNILRNEYIYNGGGVGIADFNNDNLYDLVFTGNQVKSEIYLNLGNFKFKNITSSFKNLNNNQWISGVSIVDINADGLQDVYLTSTMSKDSIKRRNQLWINKGIDKNGIPTFEEEAKSYGIDYNGYTVHSAFFDYDLDGDLDLYLLNNIITEGVPTNYRPKITDGTSINNDRFYRNEGNGKFTDITLQAGIKYEGFGLGLAVGYINNDAYPDLYISNDYIANDLIYINNKDGSFTNQAASLISYSSRFSMGNDMADINNDGLPEVITTDMMPELYARKKQTINGNSYNVYVYNQKYSYEPQFVRNMLQLHNGFIGDKVVPFSEVGQITGLYQTEWSWSPLFADFDNDGDKDLFITNGFPKDLTDKDFTNYKAKFYGYLQGDAEILPLIPIVKVSNYAFENLGNLNFKDVTEPWGMKVNSFSNGASFVDLDNDGDLDYVVNNINDDAFVYKNNSIEKDNVNTNYLSIELKGNKPNTMAIGAKVYAWSNGIMQYQQNFLSRGYISSIFPNIHFGFNQQKTVDSVHVIWSGGNKISRLYNIKANQIIKVFEKDAKDYIPSTLIASTIFTEETNQDYLHYQKDFIDFFQQQAVIPHKFSQIGPCLAAGDLNGDKLTEIIFGGSIDTTKSFYTLKENKLTPLKIEGFNNKLSCTDSDILIEDIDKDGDNDIITCGGGYETNNLGNYQHFVYYNDKGKFTQQALPIPGFIASKIKLIDFDKDGDKDLFIGARVKYGNYPQSTESYLLVNDKGRFTGNKLSFDLGMVTDVEVVDYNNDKYDDIMVSREWNSIGLLKNDKGKKLVIDNNNNIQSKHGLWSSIKAGDLDNDGDMDIVLGNLGDNHRIPLSEEYPMMLYALDIDNNSQLDPIITACWPNGKGKMTRYPLNYLDELAAQSPFFRKKFTSYTNFSHTSIDSLLLEFKLDKNSFPKVNTTSSYVLWNDSGKFTWEKLSFESQTSPVKEILIQDFDKDNLNDLLILGNDYSYDVSTGIFNSNRGVFYKGSKGKKLTYLPAHKSGLNIDGHVENAIVVDNKKLIVGLNRKHAKIYGYK